MDVHETKQSTPMPNINETLDVNESFVSDRQTFWSRFTTFTMGAVVAITVLLIGLLIFVA